MIEQPHGLVATLPGDERALSAESVPLTGVRIDVTARGTASAVSVAQRYVNREKVPVEAVYSFPLEEQAAVCGFEAQIGERRIVGRVEDAEAAFEAYDEAMAEGHGAYLLDEDRPNLFTASIGNLLPGQQAVVTVRYVAPLERLGERIRLKIPTTVAPRYVPAAQLRRMDPAEFDHLCPPMVAGGVPYGLALAIDFEGASDVLAVECASHPAQVRVEGPRAHVELSGADVQLDQDVVVSFELAEAGATTAQAARDEQGDIVVMLDVLPPGDERRAPVEAILLLDRSGSMTGSSIEQARNALLLALGALEYGDLFNVYGFGSDFESIFPAPAPYDDVHLDERPAGGAELGRGPGGTELLRPLQEIVGRPAGELPRRVLLLTDGEVGNEEECADLVGKHPGTTVFTIGIGYGASDYLVGTLARASHGRAETVHPNERIEPVVMRQMARLADGRPARRARRLGRAGGPTSRRRRRCRRSTPARRSPCTAACPRPPSGPAACSSRPSSRPVPMARCAWRRPSTCGELSPTKRYRGSSPARPSATSRRGARRPGITGRDSAPAPRSASTRPSATWRRATR